MAAWARRRQGEDRLPVTIATRRVYILPTRAGLAFAALVFVMLLAGLNYANSIALLLTFLLAGFGMIAMHLTHRNLVGVNAARRGHRRCLRRRTRAPAAHAGKCRRHGPHRPRLRSRRRARAPPSTFLRAAARAPTCRCRCSDAAACAVDRIKLSTAFPFGLFRAWTYVHLHASLLAWPVPRGRREPPPETASGGSATAVHRAGDEEWAGLREFRSGDSPRQVAWGAYARGRGLLVKTYQSPAAHQRMFDLAAVPGERRAAPRTTVGLDRGGARAR